MQSLTGYVIYSPTERHQLFAFLQAAEQVRFKPQAVIEADTASLSLMFNEKKAKTVLGRALTPQEMRQTLSHIAVWQQIAADFNLQDEDFVLIAEAAQQPQAGFSQAAIGYANTYNGYGLINLQHTDPEPHFTWYQTDEPLEALVSQNKGYYNGHGAGLYLLKKSLAKRLLTELATEKVAWRVEDFADYCPLSQLAQARVLLSRSRRPLINTKQTPRFSIIVPIYNVAPYLEQCIESVLSQQYAHYELILVDDGSLDQGFEICARYAREYPQVVLLHKINGGVAQARNDAIHLARGEYIIFLDGDDYWSGTQILSELSALIEQRQHPDVVFTYMTSVYLDHVHYHQLACEVMQGDLHQHFEHLYKRGVYVGFCVSKVIKRTIFNQPDTFFPAVDTFEDVVWSYRLVKYLHSFAIYPNTFYMYRREREGSVTSTVSVPSQMDQFANFMLIMDELELIESQYPTLYPMMKHYAWEIHQYCMKCFELLSPENQQMLTEQKEKHLAIVQHYLSDE